MFEPIVPQYIVRKAVRLALVNALFIGHVLESDIHATTRPGLFQISTQLISHDQRIA